MADALPALHEGYLPALSAVLYGCPQSGPVVSVYADLDPRHFPTPAGRAAEIDALLSAARHGDGARRFPTAVPAVALLRRPLHAVRSGRAVAGFARADGTVETIALQAPVEPAAGIGALPRVLPLLAAAASSRWCVALVSRRMSRFLLGDEFELREAGRFEDDVHRRHAQGGVAQARLQRAIEHDVAAHYERTAEVLRLLHAVHPFDRLLLACPAEALGEVRGHVGSELRPLLDGSIHIDVERATGAGVLERARPAIHCDEQAAERSLLAEIAERQGGGLAAAGADEVLEALAERRVDTLLIDQRLSGDARCCTRCGWVSAAARSCPDHPGATLDCELADVAIAAAIADSARVAVIRHERDELAAREGIAALLRY